MLAERAAKAVEYRSSRALDILAAAYAEAGEFEKAVKMARRATTLGTKTDTADIERRLELYLNQMPYRRTEPFGATIRMPH